MRLEIFMVLKILVMVFLPMTSCCDVVGYQHFRELCEMLVFYHNTTWCHNPEDIDMSLDL